MRESARNYLPPVYDESIEEAEQVLKDEKKEKIFIGLAGLFFGKQLGSLMQCSVRCALVHEGLLPSRHHSKEVHPGKQLVVLEVSTRARAGMLLGSACPWVYF